MHGYRWDTEYFKWDPAPIKALLEDVTDQIGWKWIESSNKVEPKGAAHNL